MGSPQPVVGHEIGDMGNKIVLSQRQTGTAWGELDEDEPNYGSLDMGYAGGSSPDVETGRRKEEDNVSCGEMVMGNDSTYMEIRGHEHDSNVEDPDSELEPTQFRHEVGDFDVLDYTAHLCDHSANDYLESSSSQSEFDEEGLSNPHIEVNHRHGSSLSPAILELLVELNSPYCHSNSRDDIEKMQLLQDYKNERKNALTEDKIDNILAFSLRSSGMKATEYERFRAAFNHRINLDSTYKNTSFSEKMSGMGSQEVDCCVKSCMAFTGKHSELESCLLCKEPRRDARGRRRNTSFHYSIIERLQGMFQDPNQSRALNRENTQANSDPDILADKFDGEYFRELTQRTVKVGGIDTGYKYFSDKRDISLTVSLDGFTFFETIGKHKSKVKYNTWLVIAIIDNLDPLIRTKRKNIMVLAIIPGPGSPKDLNSYLHWFQCELHLLSIGVLTWDAAKHEWFLLRAYLLWIIGDMPAIAHVMNMKGHNGKCPCRACYIEGVRNVTDKKTTHYPVLNRPDGNSIDLEQLLTTNMRTHAAFLEDIASIDAQKANGTANTYKRLLQELGINGWSILYTMDSVDFPRSFPHDLMHLGGLNQIPNLVLIWTGDFKSLKYAGGSNEYLISTMDWEEVGHRTEASNKLIPYAFSRAIPNVARKQNMTADAWFFWFVAIAPYALDGILLEPYYSHAMGLVQILRTCMKFQITRTEVLGSLTESCRKWVLDYERLYYQGREDRLTACPSTLHAWLHVPADILNAGPHWQSWAYPMEREVQWAKAGVKDARRHPFTHMAARALRREQIKQLGHVLGLTKMLDIDQRIADSKLGHLGPKCEAQHGLYKDFELCSPRTKGMVIEDGIRTLFAVHLAAMHQQDSSQEGVEELGFDDEFFAKLVPRTVERWGKVRIKGGGDTSLGSALPVPSEDRRDSSFIRYHMVVEMTQKVLYGQLQCVFKFTLPAFANYGAQVYIFALIKPCITNAGDAALERVYYTEMGPLGIADLTCFVATVGRVPMGGGRYGIVDRSTEESWPTIYEDLPDV